jgi:multidrug resistance efflux pump
MSEKADLERRAIEALRRYREALARAEELEQEEAAARKEVFECLNRSEILKAQVDVSRLRPEVTAAGQAAISRLSEIRAALSEATASLNSAYRVLAVLDEELGYIPGVEKGKEDPLENGSEESRDIA